MKTQTHTPGPWRASSVTDLSPGRHDDQRWTVDCGGLPLIAVIEQYRGEAEANARLIAAAPELAQALAAVIRCADAPRPKNQATACVSFLATRDAVEKCRAALQKAGIQE